MSTDDRVTQLENRLETLISNLAANNADLLELVQTLLTKYQNVVSDEDRALIMKCLNGGCDRDPPGCRKKKGQQ